MTMDEDSRTIWCGNLCDRVTEDILYELFLQGGPVQKVSIPKDREGKQRPFGFVTFKHAPSVQYAMRLLDGTKLFNRMLTLKERNGNKDQGNSRMEQMQNQPNHFQQAFQQMSSQVLMGQLGLFNLPPSMLMYPSQMNSQANRPYPLMNNQASYMSHKEDERRANRSHPYRREEPKNRQDRRDLDHYQDRRDNQKSHHEQQRNNDSQRNKDLQRNSQRRNDYHRQSNNKNNRKRHR